MSSSNRKKIVLVTGATGAVGPAVVNALHGEGYAIRTLSIDPPPENLWPVEIESVIGDVTDPAIVEISMKNIFAVVHMAALLHVFGETQEMMDKFSHINVKGTKNVVDAAICEKVRHVILFSTISVYGKSNGQILNEKSATKPVTFYAKSKLAAEGIVLSAKDNTNQHIGTVLRFGAIYGSRIKGNYRRLASALAKHRFVPIGNGLNRRTLIYDKDVGRAVVQALSHPDIKGKLFNVTDGHYHSLNEIIQAICYSLKRKPPFFFLPIQPTRAFTHIVENAFRAAGITPPITIEMIDKYTEDLAVDGSLFHKEIGFSPNYDLKEAWRESISESPF